MEKLVGKLDTQEDASPGEALHLVELIGAEHQHIPRPGGELRLPGPDLQIPFQQPKQLPLRMKMGSAVDHGVHQHPDQIHVLIFYNLKLFHNLHPLFT